MTTSKDSDWFKLAPISKPDNEKERLEALYRYEQFDVTPTQEESFNRLARLAAQICELPIGFINLITEDKEYKKACFGFDGQTTSRDVSFCQFTILQDDILEVEDARKHHFFKLNPNVTGTLKMVYYAGVPLKTEDGYNIGTLCLVGHEPYKLTSFQREQLKVLADEVVAQFELNLARYDLERMNREKDELIKIVSHDMRGPLMGIIGFAEVLQNEVESEQQREFLEIIENSGQALLGIVNVLLRSDFLSSADSFTVHLHKTDIVPIVQETSMLMKPFMLLKGQELNIEAPEQLEATVDPELLKQILGNLLHNACKFTPSGGKVDIHLHPTADKKRFVLSVSDNGIGMSEEIVSQLFSGSKKILREGTEGEETSGIGMTTVDKFVKMHLGQIEIASEPGKGTTVSITLPVRPAIK